MTVKLYEIDMCPYCDKVRRKLDALGVEYESVSVPKPHSKRDEVHQLSGQRSVPVLVDDGEVIADSSRIVDYLEENYGD